MQVAAFALCIPIKDAVAEACKEWITKRGRKIAKEVDSMHEAG